MYKQALRALLGYYHQRLYEKKIKKNTRYINSKIEAFNLRKGGTVIDLGANIGLFAECCLAKGATVFAYEPNIFCYNELKRRIGRNPNLRCFHSAVGHKKGSVKLYYHKYDFIHPLHMSESSSLFADKADVGAHFEEVEIIPLAQILKGLPNVELLKVDIEGGEYDLFDTIRENIDKIDNVVMETHESYVPSLRDKHDKMIDLIRSDNKLSEKIFVDWM